MSATLVHRILLLGRGVPSLDDLMDCDEERARWDILPRLGHVSFFIALAFFAILWKWKSRYAVATVAGGLNVLDAALGFWTFQMLYVCGLPSAAGYGLRALRGYAFPVLNVATILALVTNYAAFRLLSALLCVAILALLLLFGLLVELFFKPYSHGLAVAARGFFVQRAGSLSPTTAAYCDSMRRGFCSRRRLPRDGAVAVEPAPRRFEVARRFEDSYEAIRVEVVDAMADRPQLFSADYGYSENAAGQWKSVNLLFHTGYDIPEGQKNLQRDAHKHLPKTMELVSTLRKEHQIAGEAFLSLLTPGATIRPHRDYVAGTRTAHLGLLVPPDCGLRVGHEAHTWKEGVCMVFDPSFSHSAYNQSDRPRVVLLADICEPEWTLDERAALAEFKAWRAKLKMIDRMKVALLGMRAGVLPERPVAAFPKG